ncbi:MAG: Flp family type IVb pilin [Dehalococcoidia bacterium]|nr:Flp family type IVb pilin [Dehalococcoidia bacterium]
MVEYALVAALIAVVCLLAVSELGEAIVGVFERIRDEIADV